MVRPFSTMDKFTKKWIQDGGLETPGPNFNENLMKAITSSKKPVSVYRPLVNAKGWLLIAAMLIGVGVFLYFNPSDSHRWIDSLAVTNKMSLDLPFEPIQISKTVIYALGFLSLFFIQLPFLKRMVEKKYQ